MIHEAPPMEISTMPELARLAEDVARTGRPRRLTRGGTDAAMIVPVNAPRPRRCPRGKEITQADIEATLSTFGAWKGHIDAEAFKHEIKDARSDHRPPVRL
jgi:hypothetical protein